MENDKLVFKGENSQAQTNSLLVAEKFCKRHADVIRSIEKLLDTEDEALNAKMRLAFEPTSYTDSTGKRNPMYAMNRKGFSILVMGYNGIKALQFKDAFYDAFDAMENELRKPKQMTLSEQLLMQAQFNVEQEKRISAVEQRLDNMDKEREENGRLLLEAKLPDTPTPQQSVRSRINELVCEYARATNTAHRDVWNTIYKKLKYLYHISINSYKKVKPTETKLDVVERIGALENVLSIISEMINDFKTKTA